MNGEWQLYKIGLLDFWYYDEQEFDFLDGRMLLRGANGSGKSVTMQSFIPLLLDGNMRPERLDPFGSRARKMENYLLEEGDEREERTGYLYMELRKAQSDHYMTIGIGMRARKNKKLDTWYFCITDGRRIGRDLYLYKDVQSRLTLTRQELRNRIGDGGRVMETQGEYAQCVNRLLFGFETMEEYQEMIELLIQLRTPKLSKDFKPTVINEILSRSLQTLSEDDLRPMSEAIENMDSLKTNLDALRDSVRAAEQIARAYDNYNAVVLYDKARLYEGGIRECKALRKKAEEIYSRKEGCGKLLEQETKRYEALKQEESVLVKERDSLKDSDAARLKEQEIALLGELEEAKGEASAKAAQEEEKKERYRECANKHAQQAGRNEQIREEIEDKLTQMGEVTQEIPFDEYTFMKEELTAAMETEYSFQSHVQFLADYTKKAERAREALHRAENCQERYDKRLQETDQCRSRQEQKERELRQCEKLLAETRNEAIEGFYLWEKANVCLHLPDEVRQMIARRLEQYEFGTDYSEIRDLAKEIYYQKERDLAGCMHQARQRLSELEADYGALCGELNEWKQKKDPEPVCSEAAARNRELLREQGIPFLQFYKTIDFGNRMSEEQSAYMEEALYDMGILDALIVPAQYREQVRTMDPGVCDRYIFSDVAHVRQNILDFLDVDNAEGDILKYQSVANILSAIGVQTEGIPEQGSSTWVDERGNYRIGVLEGTITHNYKPRYIGVRAREKFRAEKIAELEESAHALRDQLENCRGEIASLEAEQKALETEWRAFPGDADLKVAAREYADRGYELEQLMRQLKELRERLQQLKEELDEILIQVRELCGKCYLTPRMDIVTQALQDLSAYRELLAQVQVSHGNYLAGLHYLQTLADSMESIESDLDEIRYELGRALRRVKEKEAALSSIRDQLGLTDYEQIRERLDYCLERLNILPDEREDAARQMTHWKDEEERLADELARQETDFQKARLRTEQLRQVFAAEYALGYVEQTFVTDGEPEDAAHKVCDMLENRYGSRKQTDLLGSLQESFHQNRGSLLPYQLTMQSLFEEESETFSAVEEAVRRIDITAKYRGVSVCFKALLTKLKEEAEEQQRLLSDRDRELFEDILANTVSKKIRMKIQSSNRWVEKMNRLMESMHTSSGLKLSLNWKKKRAEKEEQLDTRELVELLSKDVEIMREEEVEKMSLHFRSKIAEARKQSEDNSSLQSFHAVIREVLDYRKWFAFTLECQKIGEKKKELTDRVFFTFSGGEKAMAMYVPLFSAVVAKYEGAQRDAPRLLSLDEAFAGVDETNIRDMFRLMVECGFNFIINSQVLWGDYDTVPGLAIYHLQRPENAKFVAVTSYIWNGKERLLTEDADREQAYGRA